VQGHCPIKHFRRTKSFGERIFLLAQLDFIAIILAAAAGICEAAKP
jgi:hypothetical protein